MTTIFDLAQEMSQWIAQRWKSECYDQPAFSEIAVEAVETFDPTTSHSFEDIVGDVMQTTARPSQAHLDSGFGEPAITLFHHGSFYVDILFWNHVSTTLHQHGFNGAFQVLSGSSLEAEFTFARRTRLAGHFLLGELQFESMRRMEAGEIGRISAGPDSIHSVLHLARPTVSLVVRTARDMQQQPQYDYYRPHAAVDPLFIDPLLHCRLQLLDTLIQTEHKQLPKTVCDLVAQSDAYSTYCVLRACLQRLDPQCEMFIRLIEFARAVHGDVIDEFQAVFAEYERERRLLNHFEHSHSESTREILAAVYSAGDKASLAAFAEQRYGADGAISIVQGLRDAGPGCLEEAQQDPRTKDLLLHASPEPSAALV